MRSIVGSMHAPRQTIWPAGQLQVPAAQVAPVAQLLPHVPQFSGSVVSPVVQPPPQSVVPTGHAQALAVQIEPGPQSLPQVPQLRGSLVRS